MSVTYFIHALKCYLLHSQKLDFPPGIISQVKNSTHYSLTNNLENPVLQKEKSNILHEVIVLKIIEIWAYKCT